jgi:hypothetical protein
VVYEKGLRVDQIKERPLFIAVTLAEKYDQRWLIPLVVAYRSLAAAYFRLQWVA